MRFLIYIIFIYITSIFAAKKCQKKITNTFLIKNSKEKGAIIIWFPTEINTTNTYNKCSLITGEPYKRNCSEFSGEAKWFEINTANKYIECNEIDRYCKDESFEHYYESENKVWKKYLNKWPSVKMGEIGYPEKPCFINAEIPLKRKCEFSQIEHRAKWRKSKEEIEDLKCWKQIDLYFAKRQCKNTFLKTTLIDEKTESNVLFIWFPISGGSYSKQNICSSDTGRPLQRHCVYNNKMNTAQWEVVNENMKLLNCDSITNQCLATNFTHNYITNSNTLEPFNNTWKSVHMGQIADLQETCLKSDGLPVTRRCEYNPKHMKAEWEDLNDEFHNISCYREVQDSLTDDLNKLYKEVKQEEQINKVNPTKVVEKMTDLITATETIRVPVDIKLSNEILKIVTEEVNQTSELLNQVLNATDIIMNTDPEILEKADKINATSDLLNTVVNYLHNMAYILVTTINCENPTYSLFNETFEKTIAFYTNPTCSNISGMAIYKSHEHDDYRYRFIYMNETLKDIMEEPDLFLATYIPLSLWNKLKTSGSINDRTVITFIIFPKDAFFITRTNNKNKPKKNIIEINIPNYSGDLPEKVPLIINYQYKHLIPNPKCVYWHSKTWVTDGLKSEYKNTTNKNYLICHSAHLSYFGTMIGIFDKDDDKMLDYLSILGCSMSLLGLSCIWLTAICFRSWRYQISNKILLHISSILTIIMTFFLLLNLPEFWNNFFDVKNILHCMIMGAFLHYNILVLFSWMLIVAIMQYQRYVKVVGYGRSSNFLAKYSIAAWSLPLIPVALVAFIDPNTYTPDPERIKDNTTICYPSGKCLYYGVLLPMSIIMLTNLGIFIAIFWSLRRSLSEFAQRTERKRIILQVRVSVLLFFLLGISWIFGLLSYIESSPVFSYIFSLTSTLQGFVLFVYAIVLEKSTRDHWIILCCAKNYNTMEDTHMLTMLNSKSS
ncbi:adhesion G-protein coupled receptor G4-like [Cochliomyia hominivorax]